MKNIYSHVSPSLNPYLYDISKFTDQPSDLYKKHFKNTHWFLGRSLARNVEYKIEEVVDDEAISWFIANFPDKNVPKYTLTRPTAEQGYIQAANFGVVNTIVIDQDVKDKALSIYTKLVASWLKTEWRDVTDVRKRMANDTAAGIPFNSAIRVKGEMDKKLPLWDVGYGEYYSEMSTANYPPSIFSSSVKLEYRPYTKVFADEPRTFMPSPFYSQLLWMQYFSALDDSIIEHSAYLPFAMGYTEMYRGADKLARYLTFNGIAEPSEPIQYIESDVSGWDRSSQASMMLMGWEALKMNWPEEYFKPGHKTRLQNMFYDMVYTPIMLEKGDVFLTTNGVKSGHGGTLTFNSIMHIMMIFCICVKMLLAWKPTITIEEMADEIRKCFRFKVQGDDMIGAVRVSKAPWFRIDVWTQSVPTFGYKLKHLKTSFVLSDLEFLAAKLVESGFGVCVALQNRQKIIDSLCIHKNGDKRYIMAKLLGQKTRSYPDTLLYATLKKRVAYCWKEWDRVLRIPTGYDEVQKDWVFTYEKLRSMDLTDAAVRALHFGFQCVWCDEYYISDVNGYLMDERPSRIPSDDGFVQVFHQKESIIARTVVYRSDVKEPNQSRRISTVSLPFPIAGDPTALGHDMILALLNSVDPNHLYLCWQNRSARFVRRSELVQVVTADISEIWTSEGVSGVPVAMRGDDVLLPARVVEVVFDCHYVAVAKGQASSIVVKHYRTGDDMDLTSYNLHRANEMVEVLFVYSDLPPDLIALCLQYSTVLYVLSREQLLNDNIQGKRNMAPKKQKEIAGKKYATLAEKNKAKRQRRAARRKAANGEGKKKEKKEERKIERDVERKMDAKPKAGYAGTVEGTRRMTTRDNKIRMGEKKGDEWVVEYEGDWVGTSCTTDAANPPTLIFNGTSAAVLINPLSLGGQIANEARDAKEYCIEHFELSVSPEVGLNNTPGTMLFGIEQDPAYLAISGQAVNKDYVSSLKPHYAVSVYNTEEKVRSLKYTEKRKQWWYCYQSNQAPNGGGALIFAEERQTYQFAVVGFPDATTPSITPGIFQIKARVRFRGSKLPVTLPRAAAEAFADSIMMMNAGEAIKNDRLYHCQAQRDNRTYTSKLGVYPNPILIPWFRMEVDQLRQNIPFDASGKLRQRLEYVIAMIRCYDDTRKALMMRNAAFMESVSYKPGPAPKGADVLTDAKPVVIVDPSVALDPRVRNLNSAAKVDASGVLQTSGSGGGLINVNISSVGGTATSAGVVNSQLVDSGGTPLQLATNTDDGKKMLAVGGHSAYRLSGGPPSVHWQPNSSAKMAIINDSNVPDTVYGQMVPVSAAGGPNGVVTYLGTGVGGDAINGAVGMAALPYDNSTTSYLSTALSAAITADSKLSLPTTGYVKFGPNLSTATDGTTNALVTLPNVQYTNNSTTSSVSFVPMEAVSSTYQDSKGNTYAGFNTPAVGSSSVAPTRPVQMSPMVNVPDLGPNNYVAVSASTDSKTATQSLPVTGASNPNAYSTYPQRTQIVDPTGGNIMGVNGSGNIGTFTALYDHTYATPVTVGTTGSMHVVTLTAAASDNSVMGSVKTDQKLNTVPERRPLRTTSADPPKDRVRMGGMVVVVKWTCPVCKDVYDYGEKAEGCKCMQCGRPMIAEKTTLDQIAVSTNKPKSVQVTSTQAQKQGVASATSDLESIPRGK